MVSLECLGTGRISVASRSVAPPTRLETRTKESNIYASHWVKNPRRSESKGLFGKLRGDASAATPTLPFSLV